MDRVSGEFYKNVLILTKFVPPNDEFKKNFKEDMFEKPNTLGFINVSYFLLNVYYKDNVRHKVQWPVICKQTENKFRNDVRECIMAIASENPDINFPPIFATHLLLAKGKKFILIMWKFSLIVLRSYLIREYQSVIPIVPKPGPCEELTKTFLNNFANHNQKEVLTIRRERENMEKEANDFLRKKNKEQNELKLKILQMREDLKEIAVSAPVNDVVRKKIINTDDNEIVDKWYTFLSSNSIESLEISHQVLIEINKLLKSVSNIVTILTGNSQILDALSLDRINVDPIYELVPPEKQVLVYSLYIKNNLSLQNFFYIFNLLLQKMKINFQKKQHLELTKNNDWLQLRNDDLKTAINYFQNLHEQLENYMISIQNTDEFNDTLTSLSNIPKLSKIIFMTSPVIQINSCETGPNNYPNHLKLTPEEGAHKELFSRHTINNNKAINSERIRKPLFAQRINFDDMTSYDAINDKKLISQPFTPTKLKSNFKHADKYSRIFSSRKLNDNRVNNSVMRMMSSTASSMLPLMGKQHCISLMDSRNFSQELSQEPILFNPNLNSTIELSKLEGNEKVPVQSENKEKLPQKSNKRRSIGDLVERYKKLILKRDASAQGLNDPSSERLDEESDI